MSYREALTEAKWKRRFQRALSSKVGLRLHMSLMMMSVFAVGVLTGRVLRPMTGVMGLRYGVAVLVAYAAFFGLVRVWARYYADSLRAEEPQSVMPAESGVIVGQMGEPVPPPTVAMGSADGPVYFADAIHQAMVTPSYGDQSRWRGDLPDFSVPSFDAGGAASDVASGGTSDGISAAGGISLDADGEGLAVVVIVAVIALVLIVLFGAAMWCVWEAPVILGEAAFELVLATALVRAARRVEGRSWSRGLWRATWKPALAVFAVAVVAGAATQAVCPGVTTMHDAVDRCVLHPEGRR